MKRLNLVDAALLVLFLGIIGALAVHVFVKNPLRRAVVDEAERVPVEIEVVSRETFLTTHMTVGDAQRMPDGRPGVELLAFEIERDQLVARLRVHARRWREALQYGNFSIVPGERFEFAGPKYKLIGAIRHVRP